jgi:hypothetical protein
MWNTTLYEFLASALLEAPFLFFILTPLITILIHYSCGAFPPSPLLLKKKKHLCCAVLLRCVSLSVSHGCCSYRLHIAPREVFPFVLSLCASQPTTEEL